MSSTNDAALSVREGDYRFEDSVELAKSLTVEGKALRDLEKGVDERVIKGKGWW